jgi:Arc/MetJ-type ribon-helix-helix transcriptional regulator
MTTKIAISLPDELVERARQAVQSGEAPSVSAYVAQAMAERAHREDLATVLSEMLAESGGPMTKAERTAADRLLR